MNYSKRQYETFADGFATNEKGKLQNCLVFKIDKKKCNVYLADLDKRSASPMRISLLILWMVHKAHGRPQVSRATSENSASLESDPLVGSSAKISSGFARIPI